MLVVGHRNGTVNKNRMRSMLFRVYVYLHAFNTCVCMCGCVCPYLLIVWEREGLRSTEGLREA